MCLKKKKIIHRDVPGGSVAGNLPVNAWDTGSIPGPGRFHVLWNNLADEPTLWSLCSRAYAYKPMLPVVLNYWVFVLQLQKPIVPRARAPQQEKSLQWEACAPQLESSPSSLQLEKAHMQQQRPVQPEINK